MDDATKGTSSLVTASKPTDAPMHPTRTKQGAKKTKTAPKKPLPKPTPARGKGKGKAKKDEGVDALEALEEESSGTPSIHADEDDFAYSKAST